MLLSMLAIAVSSPYTGDTTLCFQSLLDEPNPNSPANNVAAQLYQENQREYEKRVKVIVEQSWISVDVSS